MKRTTLSSKDFSTRVTRILMVSPEITFFDSHFFFLHSLRTFHGITCYDSANYPFFPFRVNPIYRPISSQQLIHGDHQPADPAADLCGEKLLAAEKN